MPRWSQPSNPASRTVSDNPAVVAYNAIARALFCAGSDKVDVEVPEKHADTIVKELRLLGYSVYRNGGRLLIGGWRIVEQNRT